MTTVPLTAGADTLVPATTEAATAEFLTHALRSSGVLDADSTVAEVEHDHLADEVPVRTPRCLANCIGSSVVHRPTSRSTTPGTGTAAVRRR